MSTDRSDDLYKEWHDSMEKFDYFALGVLGALCAYISQTYQTEQIGINPGTLELLALLVLVLGAVFGFRRIEAVNQTTLINYRILNAYEKRGGFVSVLQNGQSGTNTQTGETYTPDYAKSEIAKLNQKLKDLYPQLETVQGRSLRRYHQRNAFTLIGFLMLLAAKLYSAYV